MVHHWLRVGLNSEGLNPYQRSQQGSPRLLLVLEPETEPETEPEQS